MKQIVCISTAPWDPAPTRKQQLMRRLPDAEVLYFDPPVSYLAPLKDPQTKPTLTAWKQGGRRVTESVTAFAAPPVLPFFNRYRAINRRNQRRLSDYVNQLLREKGFDKPILWCYSPTSCDLVDWIPHAGLVYDCVDRHSAYGGLMRPKLVDRMEAELAAKADVVFATAESLAERLRRANPKTYFVPNGADFERFHAAAESQPKPKDFPAGSGPVFGFVGALQTCIAYEYIAHAAKARPDWRFVLIGGEKPGVALAELKALPNCHLLGHRDNAALPQYMAQFDVCLNLFVDSALTAEVSPLKFYEYLATGKPIVSTRQPGQVLDYVNLIHIADSPEDFIKKCEQALQDNDPSRKKARVDQGRACSWDVRTAEIVKLLKQHSIM